MSGLPAIATRAEFARIMGWSASYVTQLAREGRLVFTEDGRHVRVAESIQRYNDTADPDKQGVRERHAASRAARHGRAAPAGTLTVTAAAGQDGHDEDEDEEGADTGGGGDLSVEIQRARLARLRFQAMKERLDYMERVRKLVSADEARALAASMGAIVRRKLEALPQILAAQSSDGDRERIYAIASDQVEQALSDLANEIQQFESKEPQA